MKLLKHFLKTVTVGVCLGLLLIFIQNIFQIDKEVFTRGYWITAPAIVIAAVLFNIIYNMSYQRKMRRIAPLLEAGKPEEYIVGVESLLQTARGQNLRNLLEINLAAGYIDIKRYEEAIHILEKLSIKQIRGSVVKMVYQLNLCMSFFYTGQAERAMKLYEESREIFEIYRNSQTYGGNMVIVDILAAIQKKQYERAERLLDMARKSWNNSRLQAAFQELGELIVERKAEPSGT